MNNWSRIRLVTGICLLVAVVLICGLNLLGGANPSPEWTYTIQIMNRFGLPILVGLLVFLLLWGLIRKKSALTSITACILLFLGACVFIAIPLASPSPYSVSWQFQYFLSFCWAFGLICCGLLAFIIATRLSPVWATLCCLTGSILFAFAAMETYLMFAPQHADGINNASAQSRYATEGTAVPESAAWENFECGSRYATHNQPLKVGHRLDKFGEPVFDVQYEIAPSGWRRLPERPAAKYDLLLFGCSFTFGYGLNDDQTWPWKLAALLGTQWRIENYAITGWTINQTLCLLEHDLIEPPAEKENFAIFLAIRDHVRRNDFYPGTPVYHLEENGTVAAGGKPAFNTLHRIPEIFSGSQLAREISGRVSNMVMEHPERMVNLYLALLKKTKDILEEKYNTRLIVLLWPDIEELAPQNRGAGHSHPVCKRDDA